MLMIVIRIVWMLLFVITNENGKLIIDVKNLRHENTVKQYSLDENLLDHVKVRLLDTFYLQKNLTDLITILILSYEYLILSEIGR